MLERVFNCGRVPRDRINRGRSSLHRLIDRRLRLYVGLGLVDRLRTLLLDENWWLFGPCWTLALFFSVELGFLDDHELSVLEVLYLVLAETMFELLQLLEQHSLFVFRLLLLTPHEVDLLESVTPIANLQVLGSLAKLHHKSVFLLFQSFVHSLEHSHGVLGFVPVFLKPQLQVLRFVL